MQAANISQPDADKLLAASRGEFVEGISDPNVRMREMGEGIETCDSVNRTSKNRNRTTRKRNKTAQMRNKTSQKRNRSRKKPAPPAVRPAAVAALIVVR